MITMTLLSILATISFSILYQVPKKAIIPIGVVGMVAWLSYSISLQFSHNVVLASFIASLIASLLSEAFARFIHMPVILFAVPGIVVLLPGLLAYSAMKAFVSHHYMTGISMATQTALVAGALASGIAMSGIVAKAIWRRYRVSAPPVR